MTLKFPDIRKTSWPLAALLAVAAALRLLYFLEIKDTDLATVPLLDSQAYHEWAIRLVGGDWGWYQTYWMGPLYPHLLALVYLVCGVQILVPLALQLGLSAVNVLLVHRLALALGGAGTGGKAAAPGPEDMSARRTALLAAGLYAFYGTAVFYAGLLLMETLVTSLVLLIVLQAVRALEHPRPRRGLGLGLLVGIAGVARGNLLVFLPALGFLLWRAAPAGRPRWKAPAAFLLGCVLMLVPVTLRNLIVARDFVLLTSNGGLNLLIGQQAEYKGIFAHVTGRPQAEFDPSMETTLEQELGRDLKGSEVSRILWHRAWERFRGDLESMPLHYLRKAYRFWNGYELPQIASFDHYRRQFPALQMLPVPFTLLAALGLPGLRLLNPRARRLLLALVMGYFLSLLPFFPTARYRLPIVPLLAIPAAEFCLAMASGRARRSRWLPAAALLAIVLLPRWTAFSQAEVDWQVHLHDASRASKRGDLEGTLNAGRLAEEARPGLADTPYHLALYLESMGEHQHAVTRLEEAAVRDPKSPLIPYRIGRNHEERGDAPAALDAYKRAAALDPVWFYPWLRTGLILRSRGDLEHARQAMEKAYALAPGSRRVRVNLASLYAESGLLPQARDLLLALTRDDPTYVPGWFNLALVSWNLGQADAARNALDRAAALRNQTPQEKEQITRLRAVMRAGG